MTEKINIIAKNLNINSKKFKEVLDKVRLGNINNECVIKLTKKGNAIIEAVDTAGVMVLHISSNIGIQLPEPIEIGIKDITILSKIFSSEDRSMTMTITENDLVIKIEGQGKITFATIDPDLIETKLLNPETDSRDYKYHKLINRAMEHSIPFTTEQSNNFKMYSSMLQNKSIVLKIIGGKVYITSNETETHTFELNMGKIKNCDDMTIETSKDYFAAINEQLDWDNPKEQPQLHFLDGDNPLVVKQNSRNIWVLSPLMQREQ